MPGGQAGVAGGTLPRHTQEGGTLPCHTQEDGALGCRDQEGMEQDGTRKGCDRAGQDRTARAERQHTKKRGWLE